MGEVNKNTNVILEHKGSALSNVCVVSKTGARCHFDTEVSNTHHFYFRN